MEKNEHVRYLKLFFDRNASAFAEMLEEMHKYFEVNWQLS
jgi:hypothetical protein